MTIRIYFSIFIIAILAGIYIIQSELLYDNQVADPIVFATQDAVD